MTNKHMYNSLDLMKFIMAFAIVAIHTCPLINCDNERIMTLYNNWVSLAVPFFFLASGYLMSQKMNFPFTSSEIKVLTNQLLKIVKLYIIWMIIYTPLAIYKYIIDGTGFFLSIVDYIKGVVFVGEHYNSWHLWYLLSTIYSLIFIICLIRINISSRGLLFVSVLFSFVSIGIDWFVSIGNDLPNILKMIQNFLIYSIGNGRILRGIVYIPIGMYLAHKRISVLNSIGLFIVGFGLNCFIHNTTINSFIIIITSIGLFGVVERIRLKNKPIYPILRNMSITVYFVHMYIWSIYYKIVYNGKTCGWDSFLVTSLLSIIIACVYLMIKREKRNQRIVPDTY